MMLFAACRKELDQVDIHEDKPTSKVEVETNVSGVIKDERSQIIPFATDFKKLRSFSTRNCDNFSSDHHFFVYPFLDF